jgi:hypothetical protein
LKKAMRSYAPNNMQRYIIGVKSNPNIAHSAILGESGNRYEAADNRMFNRVKLARK